MSLPEFQCFSEKVNTGAIHGFLMAVFQCHMQKKNLLYYWVLCSTVHLFVAFISSFYIASSLMLLLHCRSMTPTKSILKVIVSKGAVFRSVRTASIPCAQVEYSASAYLKMSPDCMARSSILYKYQSAEHSCASAVEVVVYKRLPVHI